MLEEAGRFGLGHLLEVYDEKDLERALATPARVIGINNRNLKTFDLSLENTRHLAGIIRRERPDAVIVSESGIFTSDDIRTVRGWGANAALVGESLMRAPDVAAKVRELTSA
jgi:indole-3-glycerol phosphate synthase